MVSSNDGSVMKLDVVGCGSTGGGGGSGGRGGGNGNSAEEVLGDTSRMNDMRRFSLGVTVKLDESEGAEHDSGTRSNEDEFVSFDVIRTGDGVG